jgi:hypothetical protein
MVLLLGNPTIASLAWPPAAIEEGATITPGVLGAGCSTAAESPAAYVRLPPSKFCWLTLPFTNSSLTGIP